MELLKTALLMLTVSVNGNIRATISVTETDMVARHEQIGAVSAILEGSDQGAELHTRSGKWHSNLLHGFQPKTNP